MDATAAADDAIQRVSRTGPVPVSSAQRRLWLAHQVQPVGGTYCFTVTFRIEGQPAVAALEQALSELIRRHETLRTTYHLASAALVQVIGAFTPRALRLVDLSALPARDGEAIGRVLDAAERRRDVDLERGPPIRISMRSNGQGRTLLITAHHIAADAWSVRILLRELRGLCDSFLRGGPSLLAEPEIHYADYACWEHERLASGALDGQIEYWVGELRGAPACRWPDAPLPPDLDAGHVPFSADAELMGALRQLARAEGVTMFMLLLAAFQSLLARHAGWSEVIVGADTANRTARETQGLVGCFVNMLCLRTSVADDPSIRDLLRRVSRMTMAAYANQEAPFDAVVEQMRPSRDGGRSPLFQVVFDYAAVPAMDELTCIDVPGMRLKYEPASDLGSPFELSLVVMQLSDRLTGAWRFQPRWFSRQTVERLHRQFLCLLQHMVQAPDACVSGLRLQTPPASARAADDRRARRESNRLRLASHPFPSSPGPDDRIA